ncbi:hypothetical protein GS597_03605 [Synechococcales cyanobacterium C]|uniref:Uncharacterized protein n=1 Tax=Petrachloros mirabilis ULC683 TaxID=2781853 RepID=A0A8K1ZWY0_9CYAN|nr:hypothetical protein [Petrachloros mirabilis]NCJ05607.1 hypothetical protein [Petrachloros mirabilis ULC683]
MMSRSNLLRPIFLSLGLAGTLLLTVAPATWAQLGTPTPGLSPRPEAEDPNNPVNLFNNQGGAGSLMNLLNQLQLMGGRSGAEFRDDVHNNLQSAAEEFRQKQQLQLEQPSFTEPAPALVPAP